MLNYAAKEQGMVVVDVQDRQVYFVKMGTVHLVLSIVRMFQLIAHSMLQTNVKMESVRLYYQIVILLIK